MSTWSSRAEAPVARQEVGVAVVDARVWVVGGIGTSGAITTVENYDPATDGWTTGPALPIALHHPAVATYRGEVVVVGGFVADGTDLYGHPSDRVLALRSGKWVDLPTLRRPRGAAAAAVVGETLVVVGGRNTSSLVAPTEVFDGATWRDASPIPVPRDHLGAASDGHFVFAVAGRLLDPNRVSGVVERYDPTADTWLALAPVPTARGGLGVDIDGSTLVAVGGETGTRVFGEVETFDIRSGKWGTGSPMPTPRHGVAVAIVDGKVLALVGGTRAGVAPSRTAESLVLR